MVSEPKVLMVEPSSAEFAGKYNSTQRFVDVDFNSLDVVVNLESWVMVLDFFKSNSKPEQRTAVLKTSPGYQVGASTSPDAFLL